YARHSRRRGHGPGRYRTAQRVLDRSGGAQVREGASREVPEATPHACIHVGGRQPACKPQVGGRNGDSGCQSVATSIVPVERCAKKGRPGRRRQLAEIVTPLGGPCRSGENVDRTYRLSTKGGLALSAASRSASPRLSAATNQSAISPDVTNTVSERLISISRAFSK